MKYGHKLKQVDSEIVFRQQSKIRGVVSDEPLSGSSLLSTTCQKVMGGIYLGRVIQERKRVEVIEDPTLHSNRPGPDPRSYKICKNSDLDSDRDIQRCAARERKELGLS